MGFRRTIEDNLTRNCNGNEKDTNAYRLSQWVSPNQKTTSEMLLKMMILFSPFLSLFILYLSLSFSFSQSARRRMRMRMVKMQKVHNAE
jgi:hypothetical protein